jgi:glycosyltransferase involved in cell wall biosynthesis
MRLVFLTPGTGNFHCGSCLRDHDLARALRARGHDVMMAPLYLPHVLDHDADDADQHPIQLGGINTWLQHAFSVFRHTPRWIDRLFNARPLLQWASRRAGMTSARSLGELTLAMLRGESGTQAKELRHLAYWLAEHHRRGPIDAVVLSNALLLGVARAVHEALGSPVFCTLQGEDTFLDALPSPYREQCWTMLAQRSRDVARLIAVSEYHAGVMRDRLNLPYDRIAVVRNGIALDGFDAIDDSRHERAVGYLARMCPPKGLATLVEAFVLLRQRGGMDDMRLIVAGAMTPADEPFVAAQQQRLADAGLAGAAEFLPNVDRATKLATLARMRVLSVPATYGESFGLYVLEALAAGVPVVQPRHAAFPEVLGLTGGGVLVEPNDPAALAQGLADLLADPARAAALAQAGRSAVIERFSAARMAADFERVLASSQFTA